MTDKLIAHDEAKEKTLYLHGKYDEAYKTLNTYITQQEQFAKDVANYFHVIEVFDKYKREHPDKTDEEIKEVLKDEVNTYRELHKLLSKVGKEE